MKHPHSIWRQVWNVLWLITIIPVVYRFFIIQANPDVDISLLDAGLTIIGATATVAQLWLRKPDHSWSLVSAKLYRAISSTGIWTVNQFNEKINATEENIKHHVSTEIKQQKTFQPVQLNEPDKLDLQILKILWNFISWNQVDGLLHGYWNEYVSPTLVMDCGTYLDIRRDPKYKLYDVVLESKLEEFDRSYSKVFSHGSRLVGGTGGYFTPNYRELLRSGFKDNEAKEEYEQFVEKEVIPALNLYHEFIEILRERKIYHTLSQLHHDAE